MKRRLFIGSSYEGLKIANKVKDIIQMKCGDWIECTIWNEGKVFSYNKSFLDSLVIASRTYDYGILIATADDMALIRKVFLKIPRDNVVFEMGLFLGSLGLTRAFLLADINSKLPSDYNGITIPKFSIKKFNENSIDGIIKSLNSTRHTFSLKTIPSSALALGYFDNFILPFAKNRIGDNFYLRILLPSNLDDIKSQIELFKHKNPSNEISVFNDGSRPIINRFKKDELQYWDIPTTLSTLNKLIGLVIHSTEIGVNPEKKEFIEYEIRNFHVSLEVLISENDITKDKVAVEFLNI